MKKLTSIELTPERIRYTKEDAARQLSISVRQLERIRLAGKIIGRQDGGRVFFDHDELRSYALSCTPWEES